MSTLREGLGREVAELRRVYPDIQNQELQKLIRMNKGDVFGNLESAFTYVRNRGVPDSPGNGTATVADFGIGANVGKVNNPFQASFGYATPWTNLGFGW
ncbi:hypothetical protein [Trinickia mobilis]|uniref:hypothetical protein n=1 Tax=Trinickia mobilis TaxID=2816356 RepID=UPI001A8EEF6B|nr:hypothetical protein [Trinickia mobilis]